VPSGRCIAFDDIRLRKFEVRVTGGEIKVVI
jgi:nitrite reductase/ring-hydroxylating ferredoxin subunit